MFCAKRAIILTLPMTIILFSVLDAKSLDASQRAEIIRLCSAAYAEDFTPFLELLLPTSVHVLARLDGELVSHAAWVTRWLQPHGRATLRTAYVEAVATAPAHQGRGFGSAVMRKVAELIDDYGYDIGGLSPANVGFYERLGWELWQGPLFIRTEHGLLPTPDEQVMILRLARTPSDLDIRAPLSAEWRPGELW